MKRLFLAFLIVCAAAALTFWRPANAQTTVSIAPLMHLQFLDSTGKVLAGGFLYTYAAGTTTRLDTFTDSTGTIVNAWPIPLDATGAPSNGSTQTGIWMSNSVYKFCAYNSSLVQQWCADNVSGWLGLTNLAQTWNGVQTFAQPTNFTQSDNQLIFNSASGAPVTLDIPPSNTGGPITIHFPNVSGTLASGSATGTVTSVAMTVPSQFAISGSPVTSSGTLALTMPGSTGSGNVVLATSPAITTPAFATGFTNGTGLQTVTASIPSTAMFTVATVTVTWPVTWADTGYIPLCTATDSLNLGGWAVDGASSKTTTQTTIVLNNTTSSTISGTLSCVGIHP